MNFFNFKSHDILLIQFYDRDITYRNTRRPLDKDVRPSLPPDTSDDFFQHIILK